MAKCKKGVMKIYDGNTLIGEIPVISHIVDGKIVDEEKKYTCGECCWCMKAEGRPYYCLARDLYYFVEENDKACEEFAPLVKKDK